MPPSPEPTNVQGVPYEASRKYRAAHPVEPEHRQKGNCRSYAHVYRNRGKIKKQPCIFCGSNKSQMHHPDYSRPLLVIWMCDPCHTELHEWDEKQSFATGLRGLVGEMAQRGWRTRCLTDASDLQQVWAALVDLQRSQPGVPFTLPPKPVAELLGCDPGRVSRIRAKLVRVGALVEMSKSSGGATYLVCEHPPSTALQLVPTPF